MKSPLPADSRSSLHPAALGQRRRPCLTNSMSSCPLCSSLGAGRQVFARVKQSSGPSGAAGPSAAPGEQSGQRSATAAPASPVPKTRVAVAVATALFTHRSQAVAGAPQEHHEPSADHGSHGGGTVLAAAWARPSAVRRGVTTGCSVFWHHKAGIKDPVTNLQLKITFSSISNACSTHSPQV